MKKVARYNLALLVSVHLLLFAFPWASKTFHKHHFKKENYYYSHQTAVAHIVQQPEDCLICHYELFSFVAGASSALNIYSFAYPVTVVSLPGKVHLTPILDFSHRAPPIV